MTKEQMIDLTNDIQDKANELYDLLKAYDKAVEEMGSKYETEMQDYYWKDDFKKLKGAILTYAP